MLMHALLLANDSIRMNLEMMKTIKTISLEFQILKDSYFFNKNNEAYIIKYHWNESSM